MPRPACPSLARLVQRLRRVSGCAGPVDALGWVDPTLSSGVDEWKLGVFERGHVSKYGGVAGRMIGGHREWSEADSEPTGPPGGEHAAQKPGLRTGRRTERGPWMSRRGLLGGRGAAGRRRTGPVESSFDGRGALTHRMMADCANVIADITYVHRFYGMIRDDSRGCRIDSFGSITFKARYAVALQGIQTEY